MSPSRSRPRASSSGARRIAEGWIVATTSGASSDSMGWPRESRIVNLLPKSALPAVAPSTTSASGFTTASSLSSHGRQASTSNFFGVAWIRRLPRS